MQLIIQEAQNLPGFVDIQIRKEDDSSESEYFRHAFNWPKSDNLKRFKGVKIKNLRLKEFY